ncbi:MAG: hypothetical protein EA397_16120 [Deltaproteobacteria bacterium]|nr:MAG: hypothetical protein EA397_16120 [Deltaproteobacteria bacterium]
MSMSDLYPTILVSHVRLCSVPIFASGLTRHFFLDLGHGRGLHLTQRDGQPSIESIRSITEGQEPTIHETYDASHWPAMARRADEVRNRGYNLMIWNCETYARYVAEGRPVSWQSRTAGIAAASLAGAAALWWWRRPRLARRRR